VRLLRSQPQHQPTTRTPAPTATTEYSLTRNALLRDLRCRGERGFALLTQRRAVIQHTTASPSRITGITRAALVLTQFEHKYIR